MCLNAETYDAKEVGIGELDWITKINEFHPEDWMSCNWHYVLFEHEEFQTVDKMGFIFGTHFLS